MIAKVRIAPVEQWCQPLQSRIPDYPHLNYKKLEGLPVDIDTASMINGGPAGCGGKSWVVLPESVERMDEAQGHRGRCYNDVWRACEHMLEMD